MSSQSRIWLGVAAALGAVGVALGAFGTHGLPGFLDGRGFSADEIARRLNLFETAARYHLLHALALAVTALVVDRAPGRTLTAAGWAFLVGVLVFSGLLYAMSVAGPEFRWLGAVVPIGGVALIAGWVLLAVGALNFPLPDPHQT